MGHLAAARERLAALPEARLVQASPIYETEPWGDPDQPFYANQVVGLELGPAWTPERLLTALQAIETALGRVRDPRRRYGPRSVDLDILLYGRQRCDTAGCVVPHPRLRERAFVLVPLADIAPDQVIADGQGGDVTQALAKISFKIAGNVISAGP